ncbi:MAG: tetratricopeptide repeat protein [Deferribacteraceae bacterium]|nr:tetratricopeptide repeat protein [Deferribacteraceae bacterium]
MEEKVKAAYLADLDFFHSEADEKPENDYSVPIAYLNIKLGEYTDAITIAEEGLKRSQFCTHLQVLLAEAYMHVGRKDEAREILFDAVLSDEDNYKAFKLLGVIFKSEADNDNAIKYLRAAYMKAPEDTELITWLDDIGGLANFMDKSVAVAEEADDIFDYDADDPQFGIPTLLTNAETALNELSREINNYKQQGKTLDHLISDHSATLAKQAAEQAVAGVAKVDYPSGDDAIDKAPDMSNEDILKALADANITPEPEEEALPPEAIDYSDMLSATEEIELESADPAAIPAEAADSEEGEEPLSLQDALNLSLDRQDLESDADSGIAAIARAAESYADLDLDLTAESVNADVITEPSESAAFTESAESESETAAKREEKPAILEYIPPEKLPEIPLPPTDPTEVDEGGGQTESAEDVPEDEIAVKPPEDEETDEGDALENLASALNAIQDEDEEGETVPLSALSAINEPIPEDVKALDALPKALAAFGEEDEAAETVISSEGIAEKTDQAPDSTAPFIPSNLLEAVLKEGGVDIEEVFADDSEKIDTAIQKKDNLDE